ncbi:MAG: precorrin-6A reductase, partial [Lachnospiraceae bacterium]|nr:precorrin-6A reductase [Lachnospiraceae bacterium]
MAGLMIFGGTLEGRQIAEAFRDTALDVHICVATEYGAALLPVSENIHIHAGRMTDEEMFSFLSGLCVDCCVDATHPYAVEVTRNARAVCERLHIPYIRVYRREEAHAGSEEQSAIRVVCKDNVDDAVAFLQTVPGNILITTGSKELACYTALDDYRTRCFARVLPTAKVVAACSALGFEGKNLIGMQGPFTEELNYCLLRQVKAAWLVTKSSGKEGGFPEKYDAAVRAGVNILVIGRPAEEQEHAMELPEVLDYLIKTFGGSDATKQRDMDREESRQEESKQEESRQEEPKQEKSIQANSVQEPAKKKAVIRKADKRTVYLVGMGPGAGSLLTGEARACLAESDVIIGAARMLELCGDYAYKPFYQSYKKEEIFAFLSEHPEYRRAAVVYSGDVGFYSGAKGMREL